MRIISKFKDYYDIGMGYHDDNVVYVRNSRIEYVPPAPDFYATLWMRLVQHKLFLCGKEYGFIESIKDSTRNIIHSKQTYKELYENEVDEYHSIFSRNLINGVYRKGINGVYRKEDTSNINLKYNSPIVFFSGENILKDDVKCRAVIVNPSLRDLEFVKCVDPYTIYQEIEMYISNVLCPKEKNNISVSDDVMLKSKGFYEKSFKHRK